MWTRKIVRRISTFVSAAAGISIISLRCGFGQELPTDTSTALLEAASQAEVAADLLDDVRTALPDDTFAIDAVSAEIGREPKAIVAWVHQHTRLVPYQGILRGARGVLMDRSGNSLDRALLLAELLSSAGYSARLAHATLSEAQANQVWSSVASAEPRHSTDDESGETIDFDAMLARHPRLARDQFMKYREQQAQADQTLARRIDSWIDAQTRALLAILPAEDTALPATAADLTDHWWVQAKLGDSWIDFDPTSSADGSPVAAATETVDPASLPPQLYHTVTLSISVEFLEQGAVREAKLLQTQFRPLELTDQPVTISNQPLNLHTAPLAAEDEQAVADALAALREEWAWAPVIRIGDRLVTDRFFTMRGDVLPYDEWVEPGAAGMTAAQASKLAQPVAGAFDAFSNALGGLGGGSAAPAPMNDEGDGLKVTAEWLDITITAPGTQPFHARRAIFDLLGAEGRMEQRKPTVDPANRLARALALIGTIDMAPQHAAVAPAFAADRAARDFSRILRVLATAVRQVVANDGRPARLETLPRVPWPLDSLITGRSIAMAQSGLYLDGPNVMLLRQQLRLRAGSIETLVSAEIDIVQNAVAAHPALGASGFEAVVRQGVVDSVLETFALQEYAETTSTAAQFARDLEQGKQWRLLVPEQAETVRALQLPSEVADQLTAALTAGQWVVLPPDAPQGYWWRIDPKTGTTLGLSATGAGQANLETIGVIYNVFDMGGRIVGFIYCGYTAGSYATNSLEPGFGPVIKAHAYLAVCAAGHIVGIVGQISKLQNLFAGAQHSSKAIDGMKFIGDIVGYGANGLGLLWQLRQ